MTGACTEAVFVTIEEEILAQKRKKLLSQFKQLDG